MHNRSRGPFLQAIGVVCSARDLEALQAEYALRGMFDFEDLMQVGLATYTNESVALDILAGFEVLDRTGTGRLSTDEVRRILRSVGTELKLTDAEIDDIIHFADPEDFGSVDYALMVKRLINVGGV